MTTVTLHHKWKGASEMRALALVAERVAKAGLQWTDTPAEDGIELAKMHGQEIVAAARSAPGLIDLRTVIDVAALEARVFPSVFESMRQPGGAVHGIPMGVHRTNCLWVHGGRADAVDGTPVGSIDAWENWLQRAHRDRPHPLGVTSEAWPLCLLFETLLLGVHGPDFHRAAFSPDDGSALGSNAMRALLERFAAWRRFVSDETLATPRRELVERLRRGELAAMVTGDWVRKDLAAWGAPEPDPVREWPVPGTAGRFLYNVDYFVPLVRASGTTPPQALHALVDGLLSPGLQVAFSEVKGSLPAVRDATPARQDEGWALLAGSVAAPQAMVPSFTFDHRGPVERRAAIAEAVADWFLGRASLQATLARFQQARERCALGAVVA
jgi:glucose/mannose transport system substrate-binding protein